MIIDGLLLFSSAQDLTTGNVPSTNVIDLQNARDVGPGTPLRVMAYVVTAFSSTDAATLTMQLQSSTDNSSWTTISQSRAYTAGELTAGARIGTQFWPMLPPGVSLGRYIRINYAMGALHFTPGSVTASLVLDRDESRAYPPGIGISN